MVKILVGDVISQGPPRDVLALEPPAPPRSNVEDSSDTCCPRNDAWHQQNASECGLASQDDGGAITYNDRVAISLTHPPSLFQPHVAAQYAQSLSDCPTQSSSAQAVNL